MDSTQRTSTKIYLEHLAREINNVMQRNMNATFLRYVLKCALACEKALAQRDKEE